MRIAGFLGALVLLPLAAFPAVAGFAEPGPEPEFGPQDLWTGLAPRGWGFSSTTVTDPGPLISVSLGELVELNLFSADGGTHRFLLDLNGDNGSDPGEPESANFASSATGLPYSFTADTAGAFWYICGIHGWAQKGRFLVTSPVNAPPSVSFLLPAGGERWTGGSTQTVAVQASDPEDPGSALRLWLNFSATGQAPWTPVEGGPSGIPADQPLAPFAVPSLDTTTARFNATVVDTGGRATSALSPAFAIDSTPPAVLATTPGDGATGVVVSANVVVTFSEPMNRGATATAAAFGLRETVSGAWIPVAFSWNPSDTVLTANPVSDLAPLTEHEALVNASARDASDPGLTTGSPTSVTFTTGSVPDTQPPVVADVTVSPPTQTAGGSVEVSANVTDDAAVSSVSVNVTRPDASTVNRTMALGAGDRWSTTDVWTQVGAHTFLIWAEDTSGNTASASGSFTIVAVPDTAPPTISNVMATPATQTPGGTVTIAADVTDDVLVDTVSTLVTRPDATTTNLSMARTTGDGWAASASWVQAGAHPFTIWAVDSSGKATSATGSFTIEPPPDTMPPVIVHVPPHGPFHTDESIRIEATVTDDDTVQDVRIDVTDASGSRTNVTMVLEGGSYVHTIPAQGSEGSVTYRLYAVDASGNSAVSQEVPLSIVARPSAGVDALLLAAVLILVVLLLMGAVLLWRRGRRKAGGDDTA